MDVSFILIFIVNFGVCFIFLMDFASLMLLVIGVIKKSSKYDEITDNNLIWGYINFWFDWGSCYKVQQGSVSKI